VTTARPNRAVFFLAGTVYSGSGGPVKSDLEPPLMRLLAKSPVLGQAVFLAPGAVIVGEVTLGDHASVWYNAVLRGDINRVVVGPYSNVQDNAVLHVADAAACLIGAYVTIGHGALVHACTVGDATLIGMGATILDGAVIGDQCLIGANALVTPGTLIPAGSLVLGMPAKVVRPLTAGERAALKSGAETYVEVAAYYLAHPRYAAPWRPVRTKKGSSGKFVPGRQRL